MPEGELNIHNGCGRGACSAAIRSYPACGRALGLERRMQAGFAWNRSRVCVRRLLSRKQDVTTSLANQHAAVGHLGEKLADHRAGAADHLGEFFLRELGQEQSSPRIRYAESSRQFAENNLKALAQRHSQECGVAVN